MEKWTKSFTSAKRRVKLEIMGDRQPGSLADHFYNHMQRFLLSFSSMFLSFSVFSYGCGLGGLLSQFNHSSNLGKSLGVTPISRVGVFWGDYPFLQHPLTYSCPPGNMATLLSWIRIYLRGRLASIGRFNIWKILAIVFALLNLKSLPWAWHVRNSQSISIIFLRRKLTAIHLDSSPQWLPPPGLLFATLESQNGPFGSFSTNDSFLPEYPPRLWL